MMCTQHIIRETSCEQIERHASRRLFTEAMRAAGETVARVQQNGGEISLASGITLHIVQQQYIRRTPSKKQGNKKDTPMLVAII